MTNLPVRAGGEQDEYSDGEVVGYRAPASNWCRLGLPVRIPRLTGRQIAAYGALIAAWASIA